jgi:carbamoyltransferase
VSAFYHDSAAVLVRDDDIVAAAQEERFTRMKADPRFPQKAINYCLEEAFVDPSELDAVVFYDNPMLTFDRITKNALDVAPSGRSQFVAACRNVLGTRADLERQLESCLGIVPPLLVTPHHMSHAASAFYPSPFERAALLTIDGVGEWATCSIGVGNSSGIELLKELKYPHSLGLLYSAFTAYCGFKVNSGEYKLMGLAPYGQPRYASLIREQLIDIKDDGSFRLNTEAFGYLDSPTMTNSRFEELFGGPPRIAESLITRRDMDLAASVQAVAEEIVLKLVSHAIELTGERSVAMAGGVALNCVANGRVLRESGVDGLFVQPAAGDAGGALGAALLGSHELHRSPRRVHPGRDSMKGSYLGPAFTTHEIEDFLEREEAPNHHIADPDERADVIAGALADGQIVGFFSGRMEFGPRSLGARSILGDPSQATMQSRMNLKIKFRESFRPFAPAVLLEHAAEYFELDGESPYMLVTAPVRPARRRATSGWSDNVDDADDMLSVVNQARSDIPAVTHVDYSARVQTVGPDSNPEFRRLLKAFHAKTGSAVIVNTSFNVRSEPIVCTPKDAYRCFMRTGIDLLVLEDRLLWKNEQPTFADDENWMAHNALD